MHDGIQRYGVLSLKRMIFAIVNRVFIKKNWLLNMFFCILLDWIKNCIFWNSKRTSNKCHQLHNAFKVSVFVVFLVRIIMHSDQKNSEYGHFPSSGNFSISTHFMRHVSFYVSDFLMFSGDIERDTAQKMFSMKDFFSKCDQIRRFLCAVGPLKWNGLIVEMWNGD